MIGQIYCIENKINGKRYIGKTERGVEYRWELHQRDSTQPRCGHYPLYRAMRKYGPENFQCYEIDTAETADELNNKERYWIDFYNTYAGNGNGYNATYGEDGRDTVGIDDQTFISAYKQLGNVHKVAELLGCNRGTVSNRLKKNGIELKEAGYNSVKVECLDKDTEELIRSFDSKADAAEWLIENGYSKCENIRKNRSSIGSNISRQISRNAPGYGFRWRFSDAAL